MDRGRSIYGKVGAVGAREVDRFSEDKTVSNAFIQKQSNAAGKVKKQLKMLYFARLFRSRGEKLRNFSGGVRIAARHMNQEA